MEKHIGACGMDCNSCPIPRINTDMTHAQNWVEQFRKWKVIRDDEGAAEIIAKGPYCINCQADGPAHWSSNCTILQCCVTDNTLQNCSECSSFPCEKLLEHYKQGEGLRDCLKNLMELKEK